MKIWHLSKLKEQLHLDEPMTQASLPYFIANVSIVALVAGLPNFGYNDPDMFEMGVAFLHWTFQAIIAAVGIRLCFRANGSSKGSAFFERINALGFVLLIRFSIIASVCLLLLFFTSLGRALLYPVRENVYPVLLVVSIFYWWRLISHIRSIGDAKEV
ncbi:hypothetical protein [Undibacterium sp. Xuan67W]|uniref:hypothetical protein n=1 Tax=Undibacterium sp. Xuan67W TaxID=3413057 RepID=UPI003BF02965